MSEPYRDPVAVEKFYSTVEDKIAPILKDADRERRSPQGDELECLCVFMALQWSRVPAFRPKALEIAYKINRANMKRVLKSPASWGRMLKKFKISPDAEGADYGKMKKFVESEQYSMSASNEWYVQQGLESAETILPSLSSRHWNAYVSQKGSFIASDNPVVLEAENRKLIGFENADVITYPLSRHVFLLGTKVGMSFAPLTEKLIARLNTLMMIKAHAQVFSSKPDFCLLDHSERYQTDWRLFAKEQFDIL